MAFNSLLTLFCVTFLLALAGIYHSISGPTKCVDCDQSKSSGNCFRAAVLDHVHQVGKDFHENAQLNLEVFDLATRLAKKAVSYFQVILINLLKQYCFFSRQI